MPHQLASQCFDREGWPGPDRRNSVRTPLLAVKGVITAEPIERDEELARRAASVFADDERVSVLTGDWRLLEQHANFDVFSCDGGASVTPPGVVEQSKCTTLI